MPLILGVLKQLKDNHDHNNESVRAEFIMQLTNDGLAAALNLPLRVLNLDRLNDLPQIIQSLGNENNIAWAYANESADNEPDLKKSISTHLTPEKFEVFCDTLIKGCNDLFSQITITIEEKSNDIDSNPILSSEELIRLENALQEWLLDVDTKVEPIFGKLRENPSLRLIHFLTPYLEREIWLCKKSGAPVFHELARMEPLWRVLILCWYYHNRRKVEKAAQLNETIEDVFCVSQFAMSCFHIGPKESNLICVICPYFSGGQTFNQYAFYACQGIHVKYFFLAYLSLFVKDHTDRPEFEEVTSALLRAPSQYHKTVKARIGFVRSAWALLTEVVSVDSVANRLGRVDITFLAIWTAFLAEHQNELKKQDPLNDYFIRTNTYHLERVSQSETISILTRIAKSTVKITIELLPTTIPITPVSESQYTDDSAAETIEIIKPEGSMLTIHGQDLTPCFRRYLTLTRWYFQTFTSWRIGLLSDWLQRHFSSDNYNSTSLARFSGGIEHYFCQLLREIPRADVGATLYKVAYENTGTYLKIAGDYSTDRIVSRARKLRQETMDNLRKHHGANAAEYSYSYQSFEKNSFFYIPEADIQRTAIQVYPEHRQPHSFLVMPMHMEQRMLGIIEVKGSQPRHFRWSHRVFLQQVTNVLAPYFYHQQLLQSLSEISRQMIQHRAAELISIYETNNDGHHALSSVCKELCQIFLCRSTQLWLREETNTLHFVLKGTSDAEIFTKVPSTNGGKLAFTFDYRKTRPIENPADDYFFQALLQAEEGIRFDHKKGYLYIEDPGLFLVGAHLARSR